MSKNIDIPISSEQAIVFGGVASNTTADLETSNNEDTTNTNALAFFRRFLFAPKSTKFSYQNQTNLRTKLQSNGTQIF